MTRLGILVLLVVAALGSAAGASATLGDEQALAKRYAPVVRLVEQEHECGPGEPYKPMDVNALFGQPTVALRGPWSGADLVKIAPTAKDLSRGLYEYHLDFPGNALEPGCSYERWARGISEGHKPTAYAHVATDPAHPGKLALQYWFFYAFNDWNNLHEGDWEMIQLVFDAPSAAEALRQQPSEVGYSQHEGAEKATWGDDKLKRVGATHPVVYVAAGSHANFYGEALYLGSSAAEGVGCDDTRGPNFDVRPVVRTIPTNPQEAGRDFPWIDFLGRWGELQRAFYNGPTGPNLKTQWTEPIRWSEDWRTRSYTVPGGSAFGTGATSFFCRAIGGGSRALVQLVHHPLEVGLTLLALALLSIYGIARATWRPAAPLRLARRRTWGQILAASGRMYIRKVFLFIGIGLVLVPISLLVALLQALVLHATSIIGVQTGGESNGLLALLVVACGTALTLFGLGLVEAATIRALVEIDEGGSIGPLRAYKLAWSSARPLLGSLLVATLTISLLAGSIFLLPIAIWLAGVWALVVPPIELEGATATGALRRSRHLVRSRWLKVASLIVVGVALALVIGPLIGFVLILVTSTPFWLVNLIAGLVYAVAMPFMALTTAYVYFDARTRFELGQEHDPAELPAEIGLSV